MDRIYARPGGRLLLVISLFFVVALCAAGRVESAEQEETNKYVAVRVNKKVFTEADVLAEIDKLVPVRSFHRTLTAEKIDKYRPEAIENLIDQELFYQEALKTGMEVDKKRLKEAMQELAERLGGKDRMKQALKAKGLSVKDYENVLKRSFLIKMFEDQEIEQKSKASIEEAREIYERDKSMYVRPEAWRISHIFISVPANSTEEDRAAKRKMAEDILAKIKGGEDFALVAWDYSEDPFKYKGGDMGLVHRGRMDPSLEQQVFGKVGVGEVSGVLETIYGYHIVKVNEMVEPQQLEFDDVSQKLLGELGEKKKKKIREELVSRLREKADIEIR